MASDVDLGSTKLGYRRRSLVTPNPPPTKSGSRSCKVVILIEIEECNISPKLGWSLLCFILLSSRVSTMHHAKH